MATERTTGRRHPEWIRASLPRTVTAGAVRRVLSEGGLHTVCEEARCPNRGECWDAGAATFLILGDGCTRSCRYCSVRHGDPSALDDGEPVRLADAAKLMGCRYVVITSVTRDDLPDGGASHFAAVVGALRDSVTDVKVELLVPDFMGDELSIANAAASLPDVFGHNIEVVPRLFPDLRPQGNYRRSLNLLAFVKKMYPHMPVKSGLMAGFGETIEEIHEALSDLRSAGCDMVTVGQYLQPSKQSAPVERYLHPDEFASIEKEALAMGFSSAVCGPLVRSSYHAEASASKCIS